MFLIIIIKHNSLGSKFRLFHLQINNIINSKLFISVYVMFMENSRDYQRHSLNGCDKRWIG